MAIEAFNGLLGLRVEDLVMRLTCVAANQCGALALSFLDLLASSVPISQNIND
jgi:hypothetical protein